MSPEPDLESNSFNSECCPLLPLPPTFRSSYAHQRAQARAFLRSKTKHYIVMTLVALDVAAILADIFVALIACDMHLEKEEWVHRVREGLHVTAAVFSGLFLGELVGCVWAEGLRWFREWFHCFDAFVILASFLIDVLEQGTLEEIGSLIVILRLWRFVKIVDELGVSAEERNEEIEAKVRTLERENEELRGRLEAAGDLSGSD